MASGLLAAAEQLRHRLRALEPAVLSGAQCAELVTALAATEKACAAAKALAAARAAECGAHRDAGFADAGDWLARVSGSTAREASAALQTVSALDACPATKDALASGALSLDQAREITLTETERPGSERELLDVAAGSGLSTLRERARERRHELIDREQLHRRQHRARTFRHWRDDLGMVAFRGALAPEVGVPLMNRLDAECDRIRRVGRRDGAIEPREAYAADALARLVDDKGTGRATSADVVVVVDLHALRRGHTHDGEVCHVIGGGPVPVSVAREFAGDGFLKAVVHDGVDIRAVAHLGRYKKAELRTALALGAAPEFAGVTCCEPGCERRYGLEWDHVDPVSNNGLTSYANLRARCWPHHREKTERDRAAGLLGRRAPP